MAFVSNEQKNKNKEEIKATYGRKKFFIIFTLFYLVTYIVLLALSIFMGGTWTQLSLVDESMWHGISVFGWAMAALAILLLAMTIISIVMLAKFENPRKIIKANQDNRNTEAARKGRARALKWQKKKKSSKK